jgi:hypothetical protein
MRRRRRHRQQTPRQLSLVDWLARVPEQDRQDWASDLVGMSITDEVVMALDMLGWKIVDQGDPSHLWPGFETIDSA